MASVFLSYDRQDSAKARLVAQALEKRGHEVWWDRHIQGGAQYAKEIEQAIARADTVVVLWSKPSIESEWVRDEATAGKTRGRLIPVTIDGSEPPIGFRQFQAIDLSAARGRRWTQGMEALQQAIQSQSGVAINRPIGAPEWRGLTRPIARRRRLLVVAAALMLIMLATATVVLLNGRTSKRGPVTKPTITLMPFTTASPDPQLLDIAAQARGSVSHTLSQSGIPVRLITSATGDTRSTGDFLLSGEVSKSGEKVTATVHLDEAANGVTIATVKFEAAGDDVKNLPERIGAQLAGFFDGPTLMILDRRHPIELSILAELLAPANDQLTTYQVLKRVAANAPNEPNALIGLAFQTGFVLTDLSPEERPQAVKEARQAAEKSLKLAPKNGDIYATWCILRSEVHWAGCEDHLRAGNRIDPDAPYLNGFLALLLRRVGRFEDSVGPTRLSYAHDPYNQYKIRDMLRTLELTGDSDGARKLYAQGIRWYPDSKVEFVANRFVGLLDRGDFDAISQLEKEVGSEAFSADYRIPSATALNWKSRSAVNQACPTAEDYLVKVRCMLVLANFGDLDAAYAIADKLYPRRLGRTPEETERIWLAQPYVGVPEFLASPGAMAIRRDPRFLQLAQRTGLLAYWRSGRLPDYCRQQAEAFCEILTKRH